MENSEKQNVCPHCGTLFTDHYCPHCGQRIEQEERLQFRSFMADSLNGLLSIESGFFYTLGLLAVKPWQVVRRYIHGDRSRFMAPIPMLIALLIYSAVFTVYFDASHLFSCNIVFQSPDEAACLTFLDKLVYLVSDILSSQQFSYLLLCLPLISGVYLIYYKYGSRRFNAAEYAVAAVYMLCMVLIYDILHQLLTCLGLDTHDGELLIPVALSVIALCKSYRVPNLFLRLLLLLACGVMVVVCTFAYIYLFAYLASLLDH